MSMKLGTSLRFVFPNSPNTLAMYQRIVASLPPGAFIERPMGRRIGSLEQTKNLLEVARAAREANLWSLLVGDNHSVDPSYANCFSPIPTIARLSALRYGCLEPGCRVSGTLRSPYDAGGTDRHHVRLCRCGNN